MAVPVTVVMSETGMSCISVSSPDRGHAFEDLDPSKKEEDTSKLPPYRKSLADILKSRIVKVPVNLLIFGNLILVVTETDAQSLGNETPDWVTYANYVMLTLFFLELVLRLCAYRLFFFRDYWNIIDLTVVSMDLIGVVVQVVGGALPSMSILRIFRLARLCRGVKVIKTFPKLALLVQGCISALGAIAWGLGLLSIVVLMWAILAVNVIHPLATEVANAGGFDGCARCATAYETVWASMITILQVNVAGDSWGTTTIPIIEAFPYSFVFFGACFMTIEVAFLNVILATIVESAMKVSANNTKMLLLEKQQEQREACRNMMRICEEIDADGDGSLTKAELKAGMDNHTELGDLLTSMDVSVEDFDVLFQVLDSDRSGTVSYREFVDELYKMKSHDSHTLLVFTHFYILQIRDTVLEELRVTKQDILGTLKPSQGATQKMSDKIGETKFGVMNKDAESAKLEPSINSGTQHDEGSNEMKCHKSRVSATDSFAVVSEQLDSLRDILQKDLLQRLVEISGKFDSILDAGPANTCNPRQRKFDPSGAGTNEWCARSSAWRVGLQQGEPLREAGKTGAAGGKRSCGIFGCEVAELAPPQTLQPQTSDRACYATD